MTKNDGGPAFPSQSIGPDFPPGYAGMSLRDYIAARAMQSVMLETQETVTASFWDWVKLQLVGYGLSFLHVKYTVVEGAHETAARRAYQLADAMLAAREEK